MLTRARALSRIRSGDSSGEFQYPSPVTMRLEQAYMTTAKQLYSLQELDLILDRIRKAMEKAESELSAGIGMETLEAGLQEQTMRLAEIQSQQKIQQQDTETQRERSTRLDDQLYGGSITNPRDLESLEQEASNARGTLEKLDTELIELSLQAEESQSRCESLKKELADTTSAWESRRAELEDEIKRSNLERSQVASQREELAAILDPASVRQYENLRRTKGGLGVARVERGLCQACRMSLPTQQQQKVRSAHLTVLCSSCGRILCLN